MPDDAKLMREIVQSVRESLQRMLTNKSMLLKVEQQYRESATMRAGDIDWYQDVKRDA